MSTKHTPGPWVTEIERGAPCFVVELAGCAPIAQVCGRAEATEANARLIAAAPDLLAVLSEAMDALNGEEASVRREHDALIKRMSQTLRKARS